ncbi:Ms4527A family Cys-rich leader peptide [Mycobacterium sp.]|jgi:hypothetical protein|uniref:Ms4527A family Cys-rich leader peptide n=1 Tax=Mycobacterium sp. TaxID=1785 RepID=UPI0039C91EAB
MDIDAERPARHSNQVWELHESRSDRHAASFPDPAHTSFPPNVPYRSINRRDFERYGTFAPATATFAHTERKSVPVRAYVGVHGTIGDVTAVRIFPQRVSLVARRHVDFKRVCTCCCLPCRA